VASFLSFGLIAWGKAFILRWMGPAYLDAYPPLVVLTLATTFALWQAPAVDLLYAIARHRTYVLINTLEGILNLLLSLWLVRHYGILGVALGTLGTMALMRLVVEPIWTCRLSAVPYGAYMRTAGSAVGAAVLAATLAWLSCSWAIAPNYWQLAGSATAALCFYAVLILFLVFSRADRRRVWSALCPFATSLRPQTLAPVVNAARQAP
jgi:O-antigen/teichoic acid export membrane protein